MSTQTTFAGLTLRNPIIAASSSRTNNAENNRALEDAGVGAIILKSLFEENIIRQSEEVAESAQHTEAMDYAIGYLRSNELSEYITLIKQSKAKCTIPIIASVNCISVGEWREFATLIEGAGADALELNIMGIESTTEYTDGEFEQRHINIAKSVLEVVNIPVIVKFSSMVTNPTALASKLKACGVAAVTMFNRMYQSDIDIEKMEYTPGTILSTKENLAAPLRWVAITSAKVSGLELALSGGVQNGEDVIKGILAGASAVQVCSVLYREGNEWILKALSAIRKWQEEKGYESIDEYRGKLNASGEAEKEILVRSQFLRHFGSMQ